jgi:hypothetical protein
MGEYFGNGTYDQVRTSQMVVNDAISREFRMYPEQHIVGRILTCSFSASNTPFSAEDDAIAWKSLANTDLIAVSVSRTYNISSSSVGAPIGSVSRRFTLRSPNEKNLFPTCPFFNFDFEISDDEYNAIGHLLNTIIFQLAATLTDELAIPRVAI